MTAYPAASWSLQQLREAIPADHAYRFLIHDRDSIFSRQLDQSIRHQRRPAVILQDDRYAGGLPVVLVIPLTTARAAMRFAGTTLIQPTAENGLRQASVALVFQLRAMIGAVLKTVLAA